MITTIVMASVSIQRLDKYFNSEQLEKYVTLDETQDVAIRYGKVDF